MTITDNIPELPNNGPRNRNRRGMTLVEVLLSTMIMAIVAMVLSGVAMAVQMSYRNGLGNERAVQQVRVSFDRIRRTMTDAYGTKTIPCAVVVPTSNGYPAYLVLWRPVNGTPLNANGPPTLNEVVVYGPDPDANYPQRLVEIAFPGNTATLAYGSGMTMSQLAPLFTLPGLKKGVLSDRLLLALDSSGNKTSAGSIRFGCSHTPSADQLSLAGSDVNLWKQLPWPLGIYGDSSGLRQTSLSMELTLEIDKLSSNATPGIPTVGTYYSSAAFTGTIFRTP